MPGPWEKYKPQGNAGGVFTLPEDPAKQAADARAAAADARAAAAADRTAREFDATHNPDGSPIDTQSSMDDATRVYYAQQVLAGAPMPAFGMGKQAAAARQAVMAEVAKLAGAQGATGADLARQMAHYKAGSAQIRVLETQFGTISTAEETARLNGMQFLERSRELSGQTKSPFLNSISQGIKRNITGNTTLAAMDVAQTTFANEYAKVVSGSPLGAGVLSDSARHEAMSIMRGNYSLAQKEAAYNQMLADMANRMQAIHEGINNAYTNLTNKPGYSPPSSTAGLEIAPRKRDDPADLIGGAAGGTPPNRGGLIPGSDAGPMMGNAGGAAYTTPQDMAMAKAVTAAYRRPGSTLQDMFMAVKAAGGNPSLQNAQAWQAAIDSRDRGNPAGVVAPKSGRRSVAGAMFGKALDNPNVLGDLTRGITAAGIGGGNAMTFGGLDELTGGVNSALGGGSYAANRDYAQLGKAAISDVAPLSYMGGEAIGALAQGLGGGALLGRIAPRAANAVNAALRTTPGVMAAGTGYGAASGFGESNDDRLGGAIGGAVLGAGGGLVGAKVAVPLVRKFLETDAGQAVSNAGRSAINALRPGSVAPTSQIPQFTSGERALPQMDQLTGVTDKLRSAAGLNLPFTLADAHPKLRNLAGSASRISPDARANAEMFLDPRSLDQAARAREGINQYLAPTFSGTLDHEAASLVDAGKPIYQPLYHAAYQAPPITSPIIEGTLAAPFGREALGKASRDIANDASSPRGLGFALDDMGNPVLNKVPVNQMDNLTVARQGWDQANQAYQDAVARQSASLSPGVFNKQVQAAEQALKDASVNLDVAKVAMVQAPRSGTVADASGYTTQALDYTHRGMNDILQNPSYTNQLTGRLNNSGRIAKQAQERFTNEIDQFNPAYGQARDAYSKFAKQAEGLKTGYETLPSSQLPSGEFNAILDKARGYDASLSPPFADQTVIPQMQRGYATAMSDQVGKARLNANPYQTIYGGTDQPSRISSLFPEGAGKFDTLYNLEREMAKTRDKVLGGSLTAANQQADASLLDSGLGNAVEMGTQLATGGGLSPTGLLRLAKQVAGDRAKLGFRKGAETRANDLAGNLLNPNPSGALDYITGLAQRQAEQNARKDMFRRGGGLFGGAISPLLLNSGQ